MESYLSHWPKFIYSENAFAEELTEAVKAACLKLRSEGHYATAERLEAAHAKTLPEPPAVGG